MKNFRIFINTGIFFWFSAIITWLLNYFYASLLLFLITFLFLLLHFIQGKVVFMFAKKKKTSCDKIVSLENTQNRTDSENKLETQRAQNDEKMTVISHDVVFEGNVNANQSIYVYGKVIGDIIAKDNTVRVMLNGEVTGNITSQILIVNGKVNGECSSDDIKVESNGEIKGQVHYLALEVKKGGVIIGHSQLTVQKKSDIASDKKVMSEERLAKKNEANTSDVFSVGK